MGRAATVFIRDLLQFLVRRETAIHENDRVAMLPPELCPAKSLYYVYQWAKSSASMPRNVALWDLQSAEGHPNVKA